MNSIRIFLFAVLSAFLNFPSADVDEFPGFAYLIGKDSTLVLDPGGGVAEMASSQALEHSRQLDSICNFGRAPKCVLGYHIGPCNAKKLQGLKSYFRKHGMTVAALGCRSPDKKLKLIRIRNKLPFRYSLEEMKAQFAEANDDPDFYQNRKAGIEKSEKEHESWLKSPEGKAVEDSIRNRYRNRDTTKSVLDVPFYEDVPKQK